MRRLKCCNKTIQILLIILSVVIFVCGIGLLAVGFVIQSGVKGETDTLGLEIRYLSNFFIIIGCVIFLLGLSGTFGSIMLNQCLLRTYTTVLAILIIAEIGVGATGVVFQEKMGDVLRHGVNESVKYYSRNAHGQKRMDYAQRKFNCCGAYGPSDYTKSGQNIPESCFKDNILKTGGCIDAMLQLDWEYLITLILFAFIFAASQVFSLIFSIILIVQNQRTEEM